MLLCVNIGNSNIVLGLYAKGRWLSRWRLSTVLTRTADEYELLVHPFLDRAGVATDDIKAIALASVVPGLTRVFPRSADKSWGLSHFSLLFR